MIPLYINFAESISHQDLLNRKGFFNNIQPLDADSECINPIYKEYLSPKTLRRLSPILKASLAIIAIYKKTTHKAFDAVIVGTGLGCLTDTGKFLDTIRKAKSDDLLSPTSFIQSTHNTVSGQISIFLQNLNYNITHSQNHLSFEISLLDAMTELNSGKRHVLVGGVDEEHPFLNKLVKAFNINTYPLSFCAAFFALSKKGEKSSIFIKDVTIDFSTDSAFDVASKCCKREGIPIKDIDLIFHSDTKSFNSISHPNCKNYLDFTGLNYSASALATHIAYDYLANSQKKSALIVNNLLKDKGAAVTLIIKDD